MRRQILCSTGAMTRWPDRTDHREIVRVGSSLPAAGLELGVYASWYDSLDRVAADLAASPLAFPVVHGDKAIGRALGAGEEAEGLERLAANCRLAAALEARTIVLHLWELPEGDRFLERNLEVLPACVDAADEAGLVLAVETIPCSVGTPLANVSRALARDPRCRVTLDTEFLALHGELEGALADERIAGSVVHVHVKDYADGLRDRAGRRRYLLPGEGVLPLAAFLDELNARAPEATVTLEASAVAADGTLDEARLEQIRGALRRLATA